MHWLGVETESVFSCRAKNEAFSLHCVSLLRYRSATRRNNGFPPQCITKSLFFGFDKMARSRNIKPALFNNEILGVSNPLYTLLFQSLWLIADREGRLEDRPLRIKVEAFPYRENLNVDDMLQWLHDKGFIIRYEYGNNRYIQVVNFHKHQNPHKNEKASDIPIYINKLDNAPTESVSLGLIPDSLNMIPDSLNPQNAEKEIQDVSHLYIAPNRRTYAMFAEWQPEPKTWAAYLKMSSHIVKPEQFTKYTLLEFIRSNVGNGEKMESEWQKFYVNAIARGYIKPEGQETKPTNQPKAYQQRQDEEQDNNPSFIPFEWNPSMGTRVSELGKITEEEKERRKKISADAIAAAGVKIHGK